MFGGTLFTVENVRLHIRVFVVVALMALSRFGQNIVRCVMKRCKILCCVSLLLLVAREEVEGERR